MPESSYEYDGLVVRLTTKEHTLSEILEAFENVLRGQGYCFKGILDFIDEEGGEDCERTTKAKK